ncbi:CDP-glycerol:poly(glycerophosphate) glycerophosphotransferase [Nocardiopsis sp. Huas11]|uniref:CDP-glycerol glycerophosphotransferase family protein n=1 Tax=Nocardiopsis sp. Huas11 TaxID=2183912 RepID=UPI000EB0C243|nr:CDP-glycerol glycerophosphotransferase family protein [Nocardiopsis sp. Huas11]RKS10085.1 CDP-glycerol:poly(glycerophosphate) glycerophosphotransferase [Nocardiopsis sp. Huas11]
MPEPTVIVTFDVTEPHLQHCLDSLARRRDAGGDSAAGPAPGFEVVLVPVRAAVGDDSRPAVSAAEGAAADPSADDDGAEETDAAERGEDAEQGDETVEGTREDAVAVAAAFAESPPPGLTAVLAGTDPAPHRPAARVRGAAAASGTHLLFLDGGDALTGYAVSYLAASAADTRSDLVVGNVYRFNELGASPSRFHRRLCANHRMAEDPRAIPALASDSALGNKLWLREFWNSLTDHGLAPEDADLGLRRAALAAAAVDVLPAPVLLERRRESGAVPLEPEALTRRLHAMGVLAAGLSTADRQLWDRALIQGELRQLLLRLDDADKEVRDLALDLLNAYLDHVSPRLLRGLGVLDRLLCHLVRKRRLDDVLEVATFAKSVEIKKATVVRRGLGYYIRYPFFDATDPAKTVPREVYRLDEELKVRQKTEDVHWKDGRLHISGRVGIRHLRARKRWQQHVVAFAVNASTRRRVRLPVRTRLAAEYRLPDLVDAARHDYGGFTVIVDPRRLRVGGRLAPGDWKVELVVVNRGLARRRIIGNPVAGPPERPGYQQVDDDLWVRPRWNRDRHLVVTVEPSQALVTGHRFDSRTGELELEGETVSAPADRATELRLTRRPGTAVLHYPLTAHGGRISARVRAADLLDRAVIECGGVVRQEVWDAHLVTADQESVAPVLPDSVHGSTYAVEGSHQELVVQRTATGHLALRAGHARPVVERAAWEGRRLVLSGDFTSGAELELMVRAQGRDEEHALEVERSGSRFTARFAPADVPTLSGELSLPAGGYQLWGRVADLDGAGSTDVGVEFSEELISHLPLAMQTSERTYTLSYKGHGLPVLRVGTDLHPAERGAFAQRELREGFYAAQRHTPVVDGVLFDTYTGRQYSDSPRSIHEELRRRGRWADYPMSWLVADGQVRPPADLAPVRHRGREYYEALARSRYLVTNSRQPAWFDARPDQVVVQTWHGSMLKRIGFDVENIRGKSRDYFDMLAWETRQWDYLVSPSPWATPILRSAFRFEGEILETGYPRNDIFFSPDREALAERTRRRLGLPEGKKVVLYAPTWRDDKYYTRGKHKLDLHLDLRRMYEKLGEDHVLLVRRHPRVVDSVPIVGEDFVYDVSLYPEIMELFLVTDVLVTDYSSMMFDFANTGRPMLFFTYDLESYRDNLRGFYFDFEETAPGPLLTRSDDVIGALLDIDRVAEEHRGTYRSFVERFCPLDDGHAAERVVDRVFGRD